MGLPRAIPKTPPGARSKTLRPMLSTRACSRAASRSPGELTISQATTKPKVPAMAGAKSDEITRVEAAQSAPIIAPPTPARIPKKWAGQAGARDGRTAVGTHHDHSEKNRDQDEIEKPACSSTRRGIF